MPPATKIAIRLSGDDRAALERLTRTGEYPTAFRTRARILLKADADGPDAWPDDRIAEALDISRMTVQRVRQPFARESLDATLHRKRPAGRPYRKLDGEQEAPGLEPAAEGAGQGGRRQPQDGPGPAGVGRPPGCGVECRRGHRRPPRGYRRGRFPSSSRFNSSISAGEMSARRTKWASSSAASPPNTLWRNDRPLRPDAGVPPGQRPVDVAVAVGRGGQGPLVDQPGQQGADGPVPPAGVGQGGDDLGGRRRLPVPDHPHDPPLGVGDVRLGHGRPLQ